MGTDYYNRLVVGVLAKHVISERYEKTFTPYLYGGKEMFDKEGTSLGRVLNIRIFTFNGNDYRDTFPTTHPSIKDAIKEKGLVLAVHSNEFINLEADVVGISLYTDEEMPYFGRVNVCPEDGVELETIESKITEARRKLNELGVNCRVAVYAVTEINS